MQVEEIIEQCNNVEDWLVALVWGRPTPDSGNTPRESRKSYARSSRHRYTQSGTAQTRFTQMPPMPPSPVTHSPIAASFTNMSSEKAQVIRTAIAREEEGDKAYDPERDGLEAPHRPFYLTHAVCIACAMVRLTFRSSTRNSVDSPSDSCHCGRIGVCRK